jgi:CheY-like chemotaxis protein
MTDFALAPYFHPTTICFLDDNESFLQSLDLELPGTWACRNFTDPIAALEYFRRPVPLPPLMDRCFSLHREDRSRAVIHLDLDMIEQEISHVHRFHRNSVLVVDYAMPSMNGLRFCAEVTDPYVRKAMLTGVADEKIAVEAFNAGLIHRFIPKQTADPVELVRSFVTELLNEYFNQYTARLKTALAIDPPGFLTDRTLAAYIERLMEKEGLVEYYLVEDPPGLMMLKANGEIWRIAILDDTDLADQAALARASAAPAEVQQQLDAGQAVAFLTGLSPRDHFGDEAFPWKEQMRPATRIDGDRTRWTVATWRNAPAAVDFDPATASYDAYLRSL